MDLSQPKRLIKNTLYGPRLALARLTTTKKLDRSSLLNVVESSVGYASGLQCDQEPGFKFTDTAQRADIYSTCYAISLFGLCDRMDQLKHPKAIKDYLLSLQQEDGLFRDRSLETPSAEKGQSWGWNHLVPHVIIALDYLKITPKYDFSFATNLFNQQTPTSWLNEIFETEPLLASNYFFNICIALQYSESTFGNKRSGQIAKELNKIAAEQIIPNLIKNTDLDSVFSVSKTVKTIYHLLPSMIYEGFYDEGLFNSIIELTLQTQNFFGGFGTSFVSDGCEDIDSLYHLCVLCSKETRSYRTQKAIDKFKAHILVNQNNDGGFVFRRFFEFQYSDCEKLYSPQDQSNLFATWFRVLSIAFATNRNDHLDRFWTFSQAPGYQFGPALKKRK